MRLEVFKAEDYFQLDVKEDTGLEIWMRTDDIPKALLAMEQVSYARSLWEGKKLYAIIGLVETRQTMAEVFFLPSKDWLEKRISICKTIKKDLEVITKLFNRIQMTCLEEDIFLRFADFFGFKKEGSLKCYDRLGRTYAMLAITGGIQ